MRLRCYSLMLTALGAMVVVALATEASAARTTPSTRDADIALTFQYLDALTATVTPTPPGCSRMWGMAPSANVENYSNSLKAVAVVSTEDIWAVGHYMDPISRNTQTLTMHWDGIQWTVVPSPSFGGSNSLESVEAVSSTDLWAVGKSLDTLILHWDGNVWSQVPSPTFSGAGLLTDVSVVSGNDVWAVGSYFVGSPDRTLVLHWDGNQWTQVPSPNPSEDNHLNGVAAISANDVWAVGVQNNNNISQALTMHWNGTEWAVVPIASIGQISILTAAAAVSTNDVWAVGFYADSSLVAQTLTVHWDGAQWNVVPSPSISAESNTLYGVSALSTNDVWVVGDYYSEARLRRTLTMRWNGSQWSVVPSPNNGEVHNDLDDVTADAFGNLWAVGGYAAFPNGRTLVMRNLNPCPGPTSTPARTRTPAPPTITRTPTITPTGTPPTATPCPITFTDVFPTDYFYEAVRYLYCAGVISGYSDGTFRPYNLTTRGQLCKIVTLAEGWPLYTPPTPTFSDVPPTDPFYPYIETAYQQGVISGYSDGTFRPQNNVTRGQLCKIVVLAEQWPLYTPPIPTFSDVPAQHTFHAHIETAYNRGIISGYADGTFRPANNATRGQISKIVHNAITTP